MLLRKRLPITYLLGTIKIEIIFVLIYSVLIGVWHQELGLRQIVIPLSVPAILGTVLSLLLAFRSNQAYDRWWEARVVWGSIVNESRSLLRQLQCFVIIVEEPDDDNTFIRQFSKRQVGWVYALGRSLRGHASIDEDDRFLSEDDREWAAKHTNVPNALLSLHSRDIRTALQSGWINSYQQIELNQTVTRLCDAMGKCERIKNTVFPTTYSTYIHMALYLFIIMLPLGLTDSLGYVQVPLVAGISATFLLIEKMAIFLQDPFENKPTDTPVTALAQTIERDLRQMVNVELRSKRPFTAEVAEENDLPKTYYVL